MRAPGCTDMLGGRAEGRIEPRCAWPSGGTERVFGGCIDGERAVGPTCGGIGECPWTPGGIGEWPCTPGGICDGLGRGTDSEPCCWKWAGAADATTGGNCEASV